MWHLLPADELVATRSRHVVAHGAGAERAVADVPSAQEHCFQFGQGGRADEDAETDDAAGVWNEPGLRLPVPSAGELVGAGAELVHPTVRAGVVRAQEVGGEIAHGPPFVVERHEVDEAALRQVDVQGHRVERRHLVERCDRLLLGSESERCDGCAGFSWPGVHRGACEQGDDSGGG